MGHSLRLRLLVGHAFDYLNKMHSRETIDEENPHEFPIEAKFDDGDEQNWSFDQFNEEMEKGTLQLMD